MIDVFVDDSGTHSPMGLQKNSKYQTFAGYAGKRPEWEQFCEQWEAMLRKHSLQCFHANNIWCNDHLSEDAKQECFSDFRSVIMSRELMPIVSSTSIPRLLKNKEAYPDLNIDPIGFAIDFFFYNSLVATEFQWGKFTDDVSFIFDQSDSPVLSQAINEKFLAFKKNDPRLSEWEFASKQKRIPLQAADLLANLIRRKTQLHADGVIEPSNEDRKFLIKLGHSNQIPIENLK